MIFIAIFILANKRINLNELHIYTFIKLLALLCVPFVIRDPIVVGIECAFKYNILRTGLNCIECLTKYVAALLFKA